MFSDAPRSLREPARLAERHAMLATVSAVQPLLQWAADYSNRRTDAGVTTLIPHFDPGDAGVHARVLILLEAPGPMTNAGNKRRGSGFVSIDNDDLTAENCWRLRDETGLDESLGAVWNIVPFYLGPASVKPNAAEMREGASALLEVMSLMPRLRVVIACGLFAQKGWSKHVALHRPDITALMSWHPSPLSLNQPGKRDELRAAMKEAVSLAT